MSKDSLENQNIPIRVTEAIVQDQFPPMYNLVGIRVPFENIIIQVCYEESFLSVRIILRRERGLKICESSSGQKKANRRPINFAYQTQNYVNTKIG